MTTLTSPDNLVRWTTGDPVSIVAPNNQLADSVQAALLLRAAKSYEWANKTARDAQTGMQAGYTGYQTDIGVYWYYDGTRWNPMTITAFASLSAVNTQIPSPVVGMRVRVAGVAWDYQYVTGAWRPFGSGPYPIIPSSATNGSVSSAGVVTSTAQSLVRIRDAFPSDFTAFRINFDITQSAAASSYIQLAVNATDATTAYDNQYMRAYSTSVDGGQSLNAVGGYFNLFQVAGMRSVGSMYVYGPNVAAATQIDVSTTAAVNPMTTSSGKEMMAILHRTATAYNSITFTTSSGNVTINRLSIEGIIQS